MNYDYLKRQLIEPNGRMTPYGKESLDSSEVSKLFNEAHTAITELETEVGGYNQLKNSIITGDEDQVVQIEKDRVNELCRLRSIETYYDRFNSSDGYYDIDLVLPEPMGATISMPLEEWHILAKEKIFLTKKAELYNELLAYKEKREFTFAINIIFSSKVGVDVRYHQLENFLSDEDSDQLSVNFSEKESVLKIKEVIEKAFQTKDIIVDDYATNGQKYIPEEIENVEKKHRHEIYKLEREFKEKEKVNIETIQKQTDLLLENRKEIQDLKNEHITKTEELKTEHAENLNNMFDIHEKKYKKEVEKLKKEHRKELRDNAPFFSFGKKKESDESNGVMAGGLSVIDAENRLLTCDKCGSLYEEPLSNDIEEDNKDVAKVS